MSLFCGCKLHCTRYSATGTTEQYIYASFAPNNLIYSRTHLLLARHVAVEVAYIAVRLTAARQLIHPIPFLGKQFSRSLTYA